MLRFPALFLLACALFLVACQKVPTIPEPSPQVLSTQEILARGETAWKAEDHRQSLAYYVEALNRTDLLGDGRSRGYERAARSALALREYNQAIQLLRRWSGFDSRARQAWPWNEYYAQALSGLKLEDMLQDHLAGLVVSRTVAWEVRRNAVMFQLGHLLGREQPLASVPALREVYDTAPNREARANLEQALLIRLLDHDPARIVGLMDAGGDEPTLVFPYTIMRLAAAKSLAETQPDKWDVAWRQMRTLLSSGSFADDSLVLVTLRAMERERGTPRTGIALAVPLSDRVGAIGWKIVAGAMVAQQQLADQGVPVEVRVVNTSRQGWVNDLSSLPPGFAVVGGPLLRDDFQQAVRAGLTRERVFLTFMQSLGDAQEGRDAWRFFASPQDQVRAVLELAAGKFGLTEFGVLAPQEPFGTHMTEVFSQEVWDRGLTMAAYGTYPPKSPPAWSARVAELLSVNPGNLQKAQEVPPDPGFRAVFLPDGWTQAQQLAPQFYYYESENMLLMGSELWSQALMGGTDADMSYFGLAVCPGAWWAQNQQPAVLELTRRMAEAGLGQPEFWHALGYDFVRFASRLGNLPSVWNSQVINARLSGASGASGMAGMAWSLAPMSWTPAGKARQDLFLFQPSRRGLVPVDTQALQEKMEQAKNRRDTRHELRRKKIEERMAVQRTSLPPGVEQ